MSGHEITGGTKKPATAPRCQVPGCRNRTDRGICDRCDAWIDEQVAALEARARESAEGFLGDDAWVDEQVAALEARESAEGFLGDDVPY